MTDPHTIARALAKLDEALDAIGGCSDGNCLVVKRKGMHTNGGCTCLLYDKYKAQRVVSQYIIFARAVRAIIMKEEEG